MKKLINGSTINYEDPIFNTIHYQNYIPLIFISNTMDDYSYMTRHFNCIQLKLNDNKMDDYSFSSEELEWFYQIFIPWGMSLLCNSNLNVLPRKRKKQPQNVIDEFMISFTEKTPKHHTYPEELFNAYKQFYEIRYPNTPLCTKSALIKQIKDKKGYNVYSDRVEHTARRFSARFPLIQCTLSGHQSIVITLEYLYHYLLAMIQATLLDPADK